MSGAESGNGFVPLVLQKNENVELGWSMDKKYKALIYHEQGRTDYGIGNIDAVCVSTLQECLHQLSMFSYDIILIRLLQDIEALCAVSSCIRMMTFIPVLFLVSDAEGMKKKLIHAGADAVTDMNSPAEEMELLIFPLARRHLHWHQKESERDRMRNIRTGRLVMDRERYRAYWNGCQLQLTRQEYDFLYLLASSPKRVYTFEQIYHLVWREDYPAGDVKNIIWCVLRRIRKKLNAIDAAAGGCIVSIRDVGYCFEEKI